MLLVRASARRSSSKPLSHDSVALPNDAEIAAEASLRATLAAGNPWSVNQMQAQFRLTRAEATKVRQRVLAETNGHAPQDTEEPSATEGK